MSNDDSSLDLSGAGKLAQAIPKEGWKKLINTACDTFSDLIAPITKTTAGLGGLIQAKFDAMLDTQKVFAADAVYRAKEKVDHTGRTVSSIPKAKVLIPSIENASTETNDGLREIWANLIANEMLDANVHPEFPSILNRLSSNDAMVLADIAENNKKAKVKSAAKALAGSIKIIGISVDFAFEEPGDFSREHLERLGLIKKPQGIWTLTYFGEEFVKAVTDPNFTHTYYRP